MQPRQRQLVILFAQLCIIVLTIIHELNTESRSACHRTGNDNVESQVCNAVTKHDHYTSRDIDSGCFRAAVVEYSRIGGTTDCKTTSYNNLDVFEKIAKLAKENGAQILVFPEDGIVHGTQKFLQPCLEELPDPMSIPDYNPCLQSDRFGEKFPILTRLSCLAKENGLYVIANFGTKQQRNCDEEECDDPKPKVGVFGQYLMLNTDVVIDPTGKFIRRYRKWHPFINEVFTKAPQLEHVYFDTEFGRFGVFTCFDMLFKQPALDLVEKYQIDTAIFPTWWFDELPILPAVQYQDAWSSTAKINLLAANILKPSLGSIGSGIFSLNESFYVAPDLDIAGQPRKTKLLIRNLESKKRRTSSSGPETGPTCESKRQIIEIDDNANFDSYKSMNYLLLPTDNVQKLTKVQDTKTTCAGKFCCVVDYKLNATQGLDLDLLGRVAVVVRDSLRSSGWSEQVCFVLTLKEPYIASNTSEAQPKESNKDLIYDSEAAVSFEHLKIRSFFDTKYVFPSCAHNLTRLVARNQRQMHCEPTKNSGDQARYVCELEYIPDERGLESNKLYSFGMYGRVYERDLPHL